MAERSVYSVFWGSTIHTKNEIIFSKEKVPLTPQEQPLVSLKCPISTFAEIWRALSAYFYAICKIVSGLCY